MAIACFELPSSREEDLCSLCPRGALCPREGPLMLMFHRAGPYLYIPRGGLYPFMLCERDLSYVLWDRSPLDPCFLVILSFCSRDLSHQTFLAWLTSLPLPNLLPSFDYSRKSPQVPCNGESVSVAASGALDRSGSVLSLLAQDSTVKYLRRLASNLYF